MKEELFHLQELFKESPKVTLSDQEIADFYGISIERAREYRKSDVRQGFLFEDRKFSSYYLSPMGFEIIQRLRLTLYHSQ
ncbi:MAG: hypothetical protein KFB95_03090 [Simkaniaceae bacterium]|nr:MAG: hypothetical protein KFB95_03090 [Simkaniaceae bacterium]